MMDNALKIQDNAGSSRNTSHILNCHLWDAQEVRQVVMVAPSS